MKKILLFIAAAMFAMSANAAYYLRGDLAGSSWDPGIEMPNGTITFDAEAGKNYEFKITEDASAWTGELGFAALAEVPEGVKETGAYGGNVGFTVPSAGQVTIAVENGSIKLSSTVGFGEFKEPEPTGEYYIAGEGAGDFACGEKWSPNACPLANGIVTYTALPAGEYSFKITDGTWKNSWGRAQLADPTAYPENKDNNVIFTLDSASDVTISFDGTTLSLTINGNGEGGEGEGGDQGGEGEGGEEGGDDPIDTPTGADYYLIGYINGADYGDKDDYANLGDYKFVDGSLVATFEVNSYVAIKTGDLSKWYFAEAYAGESPVTLEADKNFGEKLFVPGGVEVTFTLVENADGSLTLSYTTGTTTGIEDIDAEDAVIAAYDLLGRPVAADAAGYVILQYASGKAAKVFNY